MIPKKVLLRITYILLIIETSYLLYLQSHINNANNHSAKLAHESSHDEFENNGIFAGYGCVMKLWEKLSIVLKEGKVTVPRYDIDKSDSDYLPIPTQLGTFSVAEIPNDDPLISKYAVGGIGVQFTGIINIYWDNSDRKSISYAVMFLGFEGAYIILAPDPNEYHYMRKF